MGWGFEVCVCVCVVGGGEGRGHEFARVRGSSVDLSGSAERCICGFVVDSNSGSTPFVAESSHVSQGDLFSAAQRKRRATRVAPTPLQQQGAFPLKAASQGTLRSFIQCGAQSSTLTFHMHTSSFEHAASPLVAAQQHYRT